MSTRTKKIFSLLLAAMLLLGSVSAASAAVYSFHGRVPTEVTDADEIARLVTFFNDSVNVIKTELPKCTVTYNNYVPPRGMTTGAEGSVDELDEKMQKFLLPVLEGLFNTRSSVARGFIMSMLGDQGSPVEELELHRGMLRKNTVPVYGKDYVSDIAPAEDYDLYVDMTNGGADPSQVSISFADCTLADGHKGSVGKAFSLPSGSIDPTILSGTRTEVTSRLDDAKFQSFELKNAKIVTKYGADGNIEYYGSTIEYHFSISFYDCMNLISVVLGYDFYNAVVEAINPILERFSQPGISKESILQDREVFIIYCCDVEITDFNFAIRYFGDIDDDGRVTAADARDALRHAVKLESIAYSGDRIYADVNFDGAIDSADARLILRMSVGLEEIFSEVPEGKSISIVKIEEEPTAPETPDDEREPGEGYVKPIAGLFDDFDPALTMADIVKSVLAYIGMAQDVEGDTRNYIQEFIDSIKNAVEEEREKNEPTP